jgi:LysM repeat protein
MNSKLWKIGLIAGVHVAVIGSIMVFESCKPKSKVAQTPPPGATPIAPLPETAPPPVVTAPVLPPPVETKPVLPVALKETTHTVAKGDTLSGIAHQYGTTVTALKNANHLSGDVIRVGQKLRVPTPQESGQKVLAAPKPAVKKKAAPKKPAASPAGAGAVNLEGQYVVAAGDTPEKIAKKLGVKLRAFMDANPGLDPKRLQIGQKLNVPGGAAAAGAAPAPGGVPLPEAVPAPTVPTPSVPEGAAPGLSMPPALPPPPSAPSTPPPGPLPGNL